MPLSKARMKELSQQRRDAKRQTCDKPISLSPATNLDKPKKALPHSLMVGDLEARLEKQGLKVDGTSLSLAPQSKSSPLEKEGNTRIPLYSRSRSKTGDTVRMPGGNIVIVPERDGEGNPVYED